MSDQHRSIAETPLPWPFSKSPFTPYRLLQILQSAADVSFTELAPLKPTLEKAKLHTFDSLFLRMPVSHIPYTKIQIANKTPQFVHSEYGAYVEAYTPGPMHIFYLNLPGIKKEEESAFCLLGTGSVLLDTQILIPYAAMQIHTHRPIAVKPRRLKEEERHVLGFSANQASSLIPPCDIKVAMVMPEPEFYWDSVEGTKQRVLNIKKITKNSYRMDHHIGSLNVSLQTAKIGKALPDALFLITAITQEIDPMASATLFRPKPLKRYLSIQRNSAQAAAEHEA